MPEAPPAGSSLHRIDAFDRLRLLAAGGVITLHTSAAAVNAGVGTQTGFWTDLNAANAYDALGRFAVPCFLMISAALLLDPSRPFDLRRHVAKLVVPLVTWTVVYVLANAWFASTGRATINGSAERPDLHAPVEIVRDALAGPVAYHLWFVYVLVALYLVTPLLRPVTALAPQERHRVLLYVVGLWLVVDVLRRFLAIVWSRSPTVFEPSLVVLPAGFLGVYLLGFLLFHHPPRVHPLVWAVTAPAAFSWIVVAVWRQQSQPVPDLWAYERLNLPVLLYATAVFLLATRPGARARPTRRWVRTFSSVSYRIFLLHVLVLHLVKRVGPIGDLYRDLPVVGIPMVVITTFGVSFAVAWVMHRVTPLRSVW